MSIRSIFFAIALLLVSSSVSAKDWAKEDWEFVYEKNDIKVFRKSFPQSDVRGVAGETIVDASPGKVIFILLDHKHKSEWIDYFEESHLVEDLAPNGNIQYSLFDLPFPVSDRDFLVHNQFSIDVEQKAIVMDIKSVPDAREPEKGDVIRGQVIHGRFVLIPQGDKTIVQAEYLTDPKGLIPNWLINILQKKWPIKTLEAMRAQLKKPYVQEWPAYTNYWKPKLEALHKGS